MVDVDDHSMAALVALDVERPHAVLAKSIGSIATFGRTGTRKLPINAV
jgi:hypothetical protein